MKVKIYHNSRCKKSRAGLQYIIEKGLDYEVIEYLKEPLTESDLQRLLMKLNKSPEGIIRRQEPVYKSELKGKKFTDQEWIKIILENPKLIQRPIIETNTKAVIGDPVEEIQTIL